MNRIVKAFDGAGYTVQMFLLNAAKMGVPQKRERVFFIACRKDLAYPKLRMSFDSRPIPFREVREVYGKPIPEDTLAYRLMRYRRPTDRDLSDINRRIRRKQIGYTMAFAHDDEPVQTITSGGDQYRMCDGTLMTDRDIISCQTFPQDYDFMGQSVQYVCGMSVPPVMMAKIAEQVYQQWLK